MAFLSLFILCHAVLTLFYVIILYSLPPTPYSDRTGRRSVLRHSWVRWRAFMDAERMDQEVRHRSAATWFKVQEWLKEGV